MFIKRRMLLEDRGVDKIDEMSDKDILALSLEKPDIFSVIVDRYQEAFIRKVRKVLGNREEVFDVVQETFTKIYMNANKYKEQEGASFNSWAYRILLNTSFTYYQKLKKRGELTSNLEEEIWDLIPDKEQNFIEKASIQDFVARGLSNIPETLARILTLHFIEDLSQKEIADQEGISVSAVKTRVHRAKKAFKDMNLNTTEN